MTCMGFTNMEYSPASEALIMDPLTITAYETEEQRQAEIAAHEESRKKPFPWWILVLIGAGYYLSR